MPKLIVRTLPAVCCFAPFSLNVPAGQTPEAKAVLSFESGQGVDGLPTGWFGGGDGYRLMLDKSEPHAGKACGRIQRMEGAAGEFSSMTSIAPLDAIRDKRVRLTCWLKTKGVTTGWAGMWMRVDGQAPGEVKAFDNMQDRPLKGDTPWRICKIELDVPASAKAVMFGFLLQGNGTVWGDDFKLEVVGPSRIKEAAPPPSSKRVAERSIAPAEVIEELKTKVVPIKTVRAGNGFEDLEPLRAAIGDARIVSLGECSHGTAEVFQMKHRLLEFLVERMGFTVFAIEGNWPEALSADRYVKTGEGSAAKALADMYFWTWQTEEVRDMLEWMRQYNARPGIPHKVSFSSFDMQFPKVAAERVRAFAARMDAADRKRITDAYAWTAGAVQRMENDTTPEEQRKARKARASEVEAFLDRKRPEFPVSDNEFNEVRQCAHIVTQYLNMVWPAPGSNIYEARDRSMAENVRWIADKAFPGEKIVLWAHNGHVSKGKYGGPSRSMGDFLHEVFGSKMHVIGFASDHGSIRAIKITATGLSGGPVSLLLPPASKESAEAAFRACGDRFFLDLTHADTATALGKWLQAPHLHRMPGAGYNPDMDSAQYVNVSLPKMYDGIVFLKQSTAAKPIMQR